MNDLKQCPGCGTPLATHAPEGLCPACLLKQGMETGTAHSSDVPAFTPPAPVDLAKHFPQLEVVELIGKGGMGAVYKARQPALDRWVALKILPPQATPDPGFAERFNREARTMAKLSHPNIVAVYDFGQVEGLHYFIMEYVDGLNLRQLERSGKLSPREGLQIIPQICEALQFAHDEGIVHRDIKPENVLLDKKGRVKIADFGIAKILGRQPQDRTLTGTGQMMGPPHYMAPEQVEHPQEVDHRADIYSLGVVFYEMLTGELPIGKFAAPSHNVQVDVRLDEVVLKALEKEPERRYQQASQVKTAVETIAASPGQPRASAALAPSEAPLQSVRGTVKGPAIGILLVGILNWIVVPGLVLLTLYVGAQAEHSGSVRSVPTFWAAVPVVAIIFLSTVLIWAGLRMQRLQDYRLAIAASILAMIVAPGNLIGLPIGIWALVVLTRPEVIAAFRLRLQADLPDSAGTFEQVLAATPASAVVLGSRLRNGRVLLVIAAAVVGLILLVVVLVPVTWLLTRSLTRERAVQQAQAAQRRALEVHQTIAVQAKLQREIETRLREAQFGFDALFVTVSPRMDRAECRFENLKKLSGSDLYESISGALAIRPRGGGLWEIEGQHQLRSVHFTVDTSAEMSVLPGGSGAQPLPPPQPEAPEPLANPTALVPTFGPAVERVVHSLTAQRPIRLFDIDSGQELELPAEQAHGTEEQFFAWLSERGVDLMGQSHRAAWTLTTSLKLASLGEPAWTNATPATLQQALSTGTNALRRQDTVFGYDPYLLPTNTALPLTSAFETRQDRLGLLQITGFTEQPAGVRVRYKLLPPLEDGQDQTPPKPDSEAAQGSTPGSSGQLATHAAPHFQIRLVAPEGADTPVDLLPDSYDRSGQKTVRVLKEVLLDESAVARAGWTVSHDGKREIAIEWTEQGASLLEKITRENVGQQLAMVFRGRLLIAPKIVGALAGRLAFLPARMNDEDMYEAIDALNKAAVPSVKAWAFGPQVERVVPGRSSEGGRVLLDLDTGRWATKANFHPHRRETHPWLRSPGVELAARPDEERPVLLVHDLAFVFVKDKDWDSVTAADVVNHWELMLNRPSQETGISKEEGVPDTILFRTREDGWGILRLVGGSTDPPGVNIQYKLVQKATAAAPSTGS